MNYIVIFMLALVAVGLIMPSYTVQRTAYGTIRNKIYFSFLVAIIASSPILSLALSNYFGIKVSGYSLINFAWVGFSSSLPISLLLARSGGRDRYKDFWKYLEESSRVNQRTVIITWIAVSTILAVLGALMIYG